MEINCEKCGKHYRIDETRIKGPVARLRCRECQNIMEVRNPLAATPTPSPNRRQHPSLTPPPSRPRAPPRNRPPDARPWPAEPVKVRFGLTGKISLLMLAISLIPFGLLWFVTFQETGNRIRANSELIMAENRRRARPPGGRVGSTKTSGCSKRLPASPRSRAWIRRPRNRSSRPSTRPILDVPGLYPRRPGDEPGPQRRPGAARLLGPGLLQGCDRRQRPGLQTLIGKTSKKPALVLAVPIKRGDQIIGVMARP